MSSTKRTVWSVASAAVGVALLTGVTLATPGSGVVISTVQARAYFPDQVDLRVKFREGHSNGMQVVLAPDAQETVIQRIGFGTSGGHTGWHSHPGPVVVLVATGELTFYSADDVTCTGRTYSAGQAFIDRGQGHAHIAYATPNTELWVTYFDVPPGGSFRIDVADPGTCSF